jgi:hypothetical protein
MHTRYTMNDEGMTERSVLLWILDVQAVAHVDTCKTAPCRDMVVLMFWVGSTGLDLESWREGVLVYVRTTCVLSPVVAGSRSRRQTTDDVEKVRGNSKCSRMTVNS